MITQSPESAMPEPYKTYVKQRSEAIAKELEPVVGETDVQLCPRAIVPEEKIFHEKDSIVYGAVVDQLDAGYKSALYNGSAGHNTSAISTIDVERVLNYAMSLFLTDRKVRIKDPLESDGQGQYVISNIYDLKNLLHGPLANKEVVAMPHLDTVFDRVSVGMIALKKAGCYVYIGRETMIKHDGREVYGGTDLGLCRLENRTLLEQIAYHFDIPFSILCMGQQAIKNYCEGLHVAEVGRVSVDILNGKHDNDSEARAMVVDVTPRVGGATPAEVLAIGAIHATPGALALARTQLLYNPVQSPQTGTNFIDTETLVINAKIEAVIS